MAANVGLGTRVPGSRFTGFPDAGDDCYSRQSSPRGRKLQGGGKGGQPPYVTVTVMGIAAVGSVQPQYQYLSSWVCRSAG
jgi:hypothetical protein